MPLRSLEKTKFPFQIIGIEGIDGSGKSTLVDRLVDHFHGYKSREPCRSNFYGYLVVYDHLTDPLQAFVVTTADRIAQNRDLAKVLPHNNVFSDRYAESVTLQNMLAKQVAGPDSFKTRFVEYFASREDTFPHIVLYLKITAQESRRRVLLRRDPGAAKTDCYEELLDDRLTEEGIKEYERQVRRPGRVLVEIDASSSIDAVFKACVKKLTPLLRIPAQA